MGLFFFIKLLHQFIFLSFLSRRKEEEERLTGAKVQSKRIDLLQSFNKYFLFECTFLNIFFKRPSKFLTFLKIKLFISNIFICVLSF